MQYYKNEAKVQLSQPTWIPAPVHQRQFHQARHLLRLVRHLLHLVRHLPHLAQQIAVASATAGVPVAELHVKQLV